MNKFFQETGKQLLVALGVTLIVKGVEIGFNKGAEFVKSRRQRVDINSDIRNDIKKAA